jgi:hypothetical protein
VVWRLLQPSGRVDGRDTRTGTAIIRQLWPTLVLAGDIAGDDGLDELVGRRVCLWQLAELCFAGHID